MIAAVDAPLAAAIEREQGRAATVHPITVEDWRGWPVLKVEDAEVVLSPETARRLAQRLIEAAG